MGEVARDWDDVLFGWILRVESLADGAAADVSSRLLMDALFELRTSMMERLYAVGGEYAEVHRRMHGGQLS